MTMTDNYNASKSSWADMSWIPAIKLPEWTHQSFLQPSKVVELYVKMYFHRFSIKEVEFLAIKHLSAF